MSPKDQGPSSQGDQGQGKRVAECPRPRGQGGPGPRRGPGGVQGLGVQEPRVSGAQDFQEPRSPGAQRPRHRDRGAKGANCDLEEDEKNCGELKVEEGMAMQLVVLHTSHLSKVTLI